MGEGERDAEGGAFGAGSYQRDIAVMAEEHTTRDGETETTAIGTTGEERIEDALAKFLGDTAAGISDIEAELIRLSGFEIQGDATAIGHGMRGVE